MAKTTDDAAHANYSESYSGYHGDGQKTNEICTLNFDLSQQRQGSIIIHEDNCHNGFCGARGPSFENVYIKNVKPKEPGIETFVDSEYEEPIKALIPEKFQHLFTECSGETFGPERYGDKTLYSYHRYHTVITDFTLLH